MDSRRTFAILVALPWLAAAVATSCSSGDGAASSGPQQGFTGGAGGTPNDQQVTIQFDPPDTVLLQPAQSVSRHVLVTPPGRQVVRLALIGDAADAALSQSAVTTGEDGRAEFFITASSTATAFAVRGTVGAATSARLNVSVGSAGFANLDISGTYTGKRVPSEWVASIHNGAACASFANLPDDGYPSVTGSTLNGKLTLAHVPINAVQSVVLRGDHSIWGCKDVPTLLPSDQVSLVVRTYDVPVSYGAEPLLVTFEVTDNATAWTDNLRLVADDLLSVLLPQTSTDPGLLLDAMTTESTSAGAPSSFAARRQQGAWDTLVGNIWMDKLGSSAPLRSTLKDWISLGTSSVASGWAIDARLSLSASSIALNQAQLTLISMQGFPASSWTNATQVPLTATVDANDAMAASTYFSFNDIVLLKLLTQTVATSAYPNITGVPQALSQALGCDNLATQLATTAPDVSCAAACLGQLCGAALGRIWQKTDALATSRGSSEFNLNCSGPLTLNPYAVVTGYQGTWLGKLVTPSGTVTLGGKIH